MADSIESSEASKVAGSMSAYSLRNAPGLTTPTRVVILTAFYFLGGLLGKQASFLSASIAPVWPPAGIAGAAILLFGKRCWLGVSSREPYLRVTERVPLGFFTLGAAIG